MFLIQNRRYLGSKTRLLPFIDSVVSSYCKDAQSFADVFGGTGVVASHFCARYKVFVNDLLTSNYLTYQTFFLSQTIDKKKLQEIVDDFNTLDSSDLPPNYYSLNFGETYLSEENMRRVGHFRDEIDRLFLSNEINERERAILITSGIYAIDRIANTVGHYDAYRKGIHQNKQLVLELPELKEQVWRDNVCTNMEASDFVKKFQADIVYLDPPYNSRQYCDSYHFLENFALNSKPQVFGVAKKMDRKSLKSDYCTKKASSAFRELLNDIQAKYILISYNNTGNKINSRSNAKITDKEILDALSRKGEVHVFEQDFKLFNAGKTSIKGHTERIFLCVTGKFSKPHKATSVTSEFVRSPLNYTGGKGRVLKQLRSLFPQKIDVFYDVFCGGANVAANVEARRIVAIDHTARLIELLQFIKKTPHEELTEFLEKKIKEFQLSDTFRNGYEYYGCNSANGVGQYNKLGFKKLREAYNQQPSPSLLLLLIMFGFNNQIRFNKKNQFNLPVGKRDFNSILRKKLLQFQERAVSTDIEFVCKDFRELEINKLVEDKAFLYLDPPYYLGNASYNENNGWSEKDETDLYAFLEQCHEAGIKFALSNNLQLKGKRHTLLEDWLRKTGFNMHRISCTYSNSNYQRSRIAEKESEEVLITNY